MRGSECPLSPSRQHDLRVQTSKVAWRAAAVSPADAPLRPGDLRGLARLRSAITTPIAIDESLFSVADALEAVRHDAADVSVVKLITLGGLRAARTVTTIAEVAGLRCVAVSPYETVLGVAANLHLSASSVTFPYAAEIGTVVSAVVLSGATGLQARDGLVDVLKGPGVGVNVAAEVFDEAPAAA